MNRCYERLLVALVWMVIAAIALTACSVVRLAYDNAEWLSVRWADYYLGLDDDQEADLRIRLQAALSEHREQLLPETVEFLRALVISVDDDFNAAEAHCAMAWSQSLYRRTARLLIPVAAGTLADLSPPQIDRLAERMDETNREFLEEYLEGTPLQRVERRADKIAERLEFLTGELSYRQVRLVHRRTVALPDTAPGWHQYRTAQQQRLLAALRKGASADSLIPLLDNWWIEHSDEPGTLRADLESFVDGFAIMMADLNRSLESWQRRRLTRKLGGIAEDFTALTRSGTVPTTIPRVSEWSGCKP